MSSDPNMRYFRYCLYFWLTPRFKEVWHRIACGRDHDQGEDIGDLQILGGESICGILATCVMINKNLGSYSGIRREIDDLVALNVASPNTC